MPKNEFSSRKQRRYSKKRKMDRMLNILIAVVAVLIVINIYFIFSKDDNVKEQEEIEQSNRSVDEDDIVMNQDEVEQEENTNTTEVESENDESKGNDSVQNEDNDNNEKDDVTKNTNDIIVTTSNDSNVEQVIVNNNWEVTPTRQVGPHISSFEEGHIDYEEKLITIRNAVELQEDDIIYWSVRNDGTGKGAIAVVSSKNKENLYRVHIKWIENAGWIPIKVEKLKELEGIYEVMN